MMVMEKGKHFLTNDYFRLRSTGTSAGNEFANIPFAVATKKHNRKKE